MFLIIPAFLAILAIVGIVLFFMIIKEQDKAPVENETFKNRLNDLEKQI